MNRVIVIFSLTCIAAALASAGQAPGKVEYDKSCKSCHGAVGQGNPAIAKMLKLELRHLGSPEVQARPDAELRKVVANGIGKMKPASRLSTQQVNDVIQFVRTLKQ